MELILIAVSLLGVAIYIAAVYKKINNLIEKRSGNNE